MRNKWGEIATDLTEIKHVIKDYCEQPYANKLDKGKEKILKRHKLLKLTQKEIDNMNRPGKWRDWISDQTITCKENFKPRWLHCWTPPNS